LSTNSAGDPISPKNECADESDVSNSGVKTLIVDLSRGFGGASSRVLTLMQNFPPGQVSLAALEDSPVANEALRQGLSVKIVGKHKASPFVLIRLVSAIRRGGYQVVDTQNPQSKLWGSFAAWLGGIALVSTLNSWYMDEHGTRSFRGRFYALLELGTNFSLNRYVVVSKSIFDALVQNRVDSSKIHLIYNAVDIKSENIPSAKSSLTEKLKLPSKSLLLVTAGRFVWAKGYDDLIDAFHLVSIDTQDVYCIIAGDGELYMDMKNKIESTGLKDKVILLGHVSRDDVFSLIKACDIFVMSSRSEGTPMVLLEAAAMKKPILATKVGGIPELLRDKKECLLVPSGDINALAQGIKKLLAEKHLSERLAQAAYSRVSHDFSVKSQVRETMFVYSQAWLDRNSN
jgi:L-malate glycosyltransferase